MKSVQKGITAGKSILNNEAHPVAGYLLRHFFADYLKH